MACQVWLDGLWQWCAMTLPTIDWHPLTSVSDQQYYTNKQLDILVKNLGNVHQTNIQKPNK